MRIISTIIAGLLLVLTGCSGSKRSQTGESRMDQQFERKFFEGQQHKATQNYLKALSAFQECASLQPNNATVHYEIARIESQRELFSEAISELKIALALEPDNIWFWRFLNDLYLFTGDYNAAKNCIDEMIRIEPEQIDFWFLKAEIYLHLQDYPRALKTYIDIEEKIGINQECSLQKESIYRYSGKNELALEEIKKLSNAFPADLNYLAMLAEAYQKQNMMEEAKATYDKMLSIDGNNGLVHYYLALYYLGNNIPTTAFDELQIAFASADVGIDQKIGVLLNLYTITENDGSWLPQTYDLIQTCKEAHPNEAKIFAIWGDFLWRDQKAVEAIEAYSTCVTLDPSKSLVWQQLLGIEIHFNYMDLLAEHSQQAISYFPSTPEYYLYQGIAQARLGNHADAIEALQSGVHYVVDNNSLLAQFYAAIGESANALEDFPESDKAYNKAISLQPNDAYVLNNYSYYLSLRNTRLDQAEKMAKRANELTPGRPSIQDTYAWILYQQKKYDEALTWIELAISSGGNSESTILEHYGDILLALGRQEEALTIWKMAIEAGGDELIINLKISGLPGND